MTLPTTQLEAIRSLQAHVGEGNRARGFREDEEELDDIIGVVETSLSLIEEGEVEVIEFGAGLLKKLSKALKNAKLHGHANRLLLIVSEVVEAHEALRSGHGVNETYYIDEDGNKTHERFRPDGTPRKPEGVPSEIADVKIRTLDFADNVTMDLAAIVDEKDAYNATRPYRHGRKF
ncbi:MAG: hypothetical protein K0S65_3640 [Labilithrix sp.]|jgi:NTP pyrophosphatase (non-canonical NTP hydrolase)|nr:hypothetical protein [Labilithrix sp.]